MLSTLTQKSEPVAKKTILGMPSQELENPIGATPSHEFQSIDNEHLIKIVTDESAKTLQVQS